MNAYFTNQIARIARFSALCGSAITAVFLIFAFSIDSRINYGYDNLLLDDVDFFGLRVILCLLVALIASYAIASKEKFAMAGSALAIACVAAFYAFCRFSSGIPLSPMVALLALPACFHVLASQAQEATLEPEVISLPSEATPVTNTAEPALAAG